MRRTFVAGSVVALACLCVTGVARGQGPPGTDIYLVSTTNTSGLVRFGDPVNITDRNGYDNQPSFTPDGRSILYTSNRGGQTDIYRYDIRSRATIRVTDTQPESEYSPTVTPTGTSFTVIRVEADSAQRLWEFGLDGHDPRIVLMEVAPVGYHAWATATTVVLFVLGSPSTLQVADRTTGQSEIVAYNVGRSLHKIPGRNSISFAHRVSEDAFLIKELELETRVVRPLVRLLDGNEFYAWMADGTVLMGQDTRLFRAAAADGWVWKQVVDFSDTGLQQISRLAVSPRGDWIAIVGNRPNS